MKTLNNLQLRQCPVCKTKNYQVLFHMTMSKVFEVNPTYNVKWFNENSIAPNFYFPIVKCDSCDFVFSLYKMKEEVAFSYYNEGINSQLSKAKIYKKGKRLFFINIWNKLSHLSCEYDCIKVLDYGGGWGDFLAIAKSPGVEVFGLEFDLRKIEFAKSIGIPLGNNQFIKNNAPYDIFLCNQVLEHLDKPRETLRQLRSLLKKGSIGFISVPNFCTENLNNQISLAKKKQRLSKELDPLGHLNYFTPQNFRELIIDEGFEILLDNSNAKGSSKTSIFPLSQLLKKKENAKLGTNIYVKAI